METVSDLHVAGDITDTDISVTSGGEELPPLVLFKRLMAGLPSSYCAALSMLASDEGSASVHECDTLRRFRLVDVGGEELPPLALALFKRLVAGLPSSYCGALSMLASDEGSASVRGLECGSALRRLRLIAVFIVVSDGLLDPESSPVLLRSRARRRRPVTFVGRFSSGVLLPRM